MTTLREIAEGWSALALTLAWQAALLAGLALACEVMLRLRQARVRHLLWWLVLTTPFLLAPARLALKGHAATVAVPAPPPLVRAIALTEALVPGTPGPVAPRVATRPAGGEARSLLPASSPAYVGAREQLTTPLWMMGIWLLGCAVTVARLLLGHRALRRLVASSRPVTQGAAREALEARGAAVGLTRRPELRASDELHAPLLYGVRRPIILIPEDWLEGLSPSDLEVALSHEVAHVRRGDCLANLVQRVAEAPLFFHPAAWLASRRIGQAREELCDATALGEGADPRTYALALLAAAERARGTLALASVGVAEARFTLLKRVEAVMRGRNRQQLSRVAAAALSLALVTAGLALAAVDIAGEAAPVAPKVLFSTCTPGHPSGPGLFVADADLGNPIRLTTPRPEPSGEDNSPGSASGCDVGAWSPDGTRVVMARNMLLYVLDLKALVETPEQEPEPIREAGGGILGGGNPSWSPDGRRIVFHNGEGVVVVNPDGSDCRVVAPTGEWAREPEWSPDGKAIAFRYYPAERLGQWYSHLYVVTELDAARPRVKQLTRDAAWSEYWPHWSPDSKTLAFTRGKAGVESQDGDVWLLDLATGREHQLTSTPELLEQAIGWSPYDGKIYYREFAPNPKGNDPGYLVRVSPDGSGEERFARDFLPSGRITWARATTWVEAVQALPGEQVVAKLGQQQAEGTAEVITDIDYATGPGSITPREVTKGASIRDWTMLQPWAENGMLSLHAYANDPRRGALEGPAHLFDLQLENAPWAEPGSLQLLTPRDLYLGDWQGRPLGGASLAGGVRTIPFASLALSITHTHVTKQGEVEVQVTVEARDREGRRRTSFSGPVAVGSYRHPASVEYWVTPNKVWPAQPNTVLLERGVWIGKVVVSRPEPGARLLVYWQDIADSSDPLIPER